MGLYGSPSLENDNTYNKNCIFCSRCGTRYSKKQRKCPECKKRHTEMFYNRWWFWVLVCFLAIGFIPSSNVEREASVSNNVQNEVAILEEEYKGKCIELNYNDIARNPNNYVGQFVKFKGNVVQVQEDGNYVMLRVNTFVDSYGVGKDTIYIDYVRKSADESRILEKDNVTIYGIMNGIKSYKAVLGNQISIPYIKAEYIELN